MAEKNSNPVETVFSGAVMLLIGFVGGGVLTLGTQVIIARFLSPDLFGVFSQSMSVLYALVMVSMLGLNAGVSRYISFNDQDETKAEKAVGSSLAVTLPVSVLVFSTLYFFAGPISTIVFNDPRTATVLKIFAVAGPAMAVNSIFISGFRGHQQSKERVFLLDFFIPFIQVLGVSTAIFLGYSLGGTAVGYMSAFLFATLAITWWYRKNHRIETSLPVLKQLVKFSWPLMVSAVSVQLFLWSPSIIVGALAASRDVGLLNSALPVAASTKMFLSAMAFLFMPVTAELFSKNKLEELKDVHSTSTRWIVNLSLPALAFLFFFSEPTVELLFGSSYTTAGIALSIMAAGYFFNMVTGPVGELLISVGRTKREMVANLFKLLLFLVLGFLLVPEHGFVGGAAAYATGMAAGNVLRIFFCRDYIGFFYNREFLKPILAVVIGLPFAILLQDLSVIASGISYCGIYVLSLFIMSPFGMQEKEAVNNFLENTGLDSYSYVRKTVNLLLR